jgi:flagellar motor switch protein FliM
MSLLTGKGKAPEAVSPQGMTRYDPATQQRQIRDRLHALDRINERFARTFRAGLFTLLRKSADVTVGNIVHLSQAGLGKLSNEAMNYNLISMKPLRGSGLISFPSSLIFMAIENLFGGEGRTVESTNHREYTPTEQRIIERLLALAMEAYKQAWGAFYPVMPEFIRSESVSRFANIANSPTETLICTTFTVELSNFEADFHITFPFSMVEPIKELLANTQSGDHAEDPETWNQRIGGEIQDSRIELVGDFLYIDTLISDFVALKVGDVLPISLPKQVTARVNDVPVMVCDYGVCDGHSALRVNEFINHALLNNKPSKRFVKGASKEVRDLQND